MCSISDKSVNEQDWSESVEDRFVYISSAQVDSRTVSISILFSFGLRCAERWRLLCDKRQGRILVLPYLDCC
jgi:hypothetical protein